MTRRPSTRVFVIAAVLVTLALAGVASYYASGSPDGLERVATDKGFDSAAKDSGTAESPMADYSTKGVDDPRLSGGLAGVAGVVVVLVLAGGLGYVVQRRAREPEPQLESSNEA